VTQFTIEAHPIGEVWGGLRTYADSEREDLYTALHNFVATGSDDPKAAVIFTDIIAVEETPVIIVYYFYDGVEAPTTGAFADFLTIPAELDVMSAQSYSQLLETNGLDASLLNARVSFRVSPHGPFLSTTLLVLVTSTCN
jgi:hypothetical protein